ncbi:hypothetical protein HYV30_03570 [Candidatus Kaiserbacteria bacterium]|nr:hypothetical protein [Candidatus Kaiserbacteria bacterium]
MHRLVLFVLLLVLLPFRPALAQETPVSGRAWTDIAGNPFVGDPSVALARMPIDRVARESILVERNKVTVSLATVDGYLPRGAQRDKVLAEARRLGYDKSRLYIENVQAVLSAAQVPGWREIAAKIEREQIDASALQIYRKTMAVGDTCTWMQFGLYKQVEKVTYRPSTGSLERLNPVYLHADGKSLVTYAFHHRVGNVGTVLYEPAVCHNLCVRTYTMDLVQRYTPPPPAPPSPPAEVARPAPSPEPGSTADCPIVSGLDVNAFLMDDIEKHPELLDRVKALIDVAKGRNSDGGSILAAYEGDAVSRTLYDQLDKVVQTRAPFNENVRVYLRHPGTLQLAQDLGTLSLQNGRATIPLSDSQKRQVIEIIFPRYFQSPAESGGERRIRVLPREWEGKAGGKLWCLKHAAAAYWRKDMP